MTPSFAERMPRPRLITGRLSLSARRSFHLELVYLIITKNTRANLPIYEQAERAYLEALCHIAWADSRMRRRFSQMINGTATTNESSAIACAWRKPSRTRLSSRRNEIQKRPAEYRAM